MEKFSEMLRKFIGAERNINRNTYIIMKKVFLMIELGVEETEVFSFINSLGGIC